MDPTAIGAGSRKGQIQLSEAAAEPQRLSALFALGDGGSSRAQRYEVRETEGGRSLRCKELPGVLVRVDSKYAFSEADARKLGERVILLDGAGNFGPLVDNDARLYNLDHHRSCIRAFTLATCEQALVIVVKGLDLARGDWSIYANQPDLDTVLAIWVLLNHRRIRELSPTSRDTLLPLVRLEGAIDANGEVGAEYSGLPQDLYRSTRATLDGLLARGETARMASGGDLLLFTAEMLSELDAAIYGEEGGLSELAGIEQEFGHFALGDDRVGVVGRDSAGIYAVERRLRELWGERLGLIALQTSSGVYTLRRTNLFARADLHPAYDLLNLVDRGASFRRGGSLWGGADDIGGSPRPLGSRLTPSELLELLPLAYQRPGGGAARLATGMVLSLAFALLGGALALKGFGWLSPTALAIEGTGWLPSAALAPGAALLALVPLMLLVSHGRWWTLGWRPPAGLAWIGLGPVVIAATALGGGWLPQPVKLPDLNGAIPIVIAWLALNALAVEGWFRGMVHGLWVLDGRVQRPRGSWFVSRAALFSSVLYALGLVVALRLVAAPGLSVELNFPEMAQTFGVALVAGLALAALRERCASLWPVVIAHALGLLARIASPL
jgi:hypothetical protein